jgi:phosphotransferase system enzyme I (PtsI)
MALAESLSDLVEGRQLIDAHILLVDDPVMQSDVRRRISEDLLGAESAVSQVLHEVIERFEHMQDPYARERGADVRDVGRRVLNKLLGTEREALGRMSTPVVLVARELDPSVTAGLARDRILGIATDVGGSTSHTSILARSLGIPAVVALKDVAERVLPRQTIIVDGIHGRVILDPEPDELHYYNELAKRYSETQDAIAMNAEEPAVTADGRTVELAANIEFSQEADLVRRYGGRGVGLFRTEFLHLLSPDTDDEEMQYKAYVHVLKVLYPEPVIIRTLDLGGDKFLNSPEFHERNPFLGYRAIRICLDRPHLFRRQLRAVLRASAEGNARLMIPMVTEVSQVRRTRALITEICEELTASGVAFDPRLQVGMMVETPAATIAMDFFAPHVDFVSIGTNDLTQYTLAVDRGSPLVASLFDPMHPAVLRQIDMVVRSCHSAGRWVGVCGQMASDPLAVPLLLGLGVDELSVPVTQIPDIKQMIRITDMQMAEGLAATALATGSGQEVRHLLRTAVADRFPGILLSGNS